MILTTNLFSALLFCVTAFYVLYVLIPSFRRRTIYLPLLTLMVLLILFLFLFLSNLSSNPVLSYTIFDVESVMFVLTLNRLIMFTVFFIILLFLGIYKRKEKKDHWYFSGLFISLFFFSGNLLTLLLGVILLVLLIFMLYPWKSNKFLDTLQKLHKSRSLSLHQTVIPCIHEYSDKKITILQTLFITISFIIIMIDVLR
ncbi:MAG: hypothetical protein PHS99_02070 [Candidatus Marinimicrobia bacterium]|nr:hypothetical protein [Candidatus Neomarinimicrobiota bacterium]